MRKSRLCCVGIGNTAESPVGAAPGPGRRLPATAGRMPVP